jgi:hypothetical protein
LGEAQAAAERQKTNVRAIVPIRFMIQFHWRKISPVSKRLLLERVDGKV